jgi:pseudouridine-5'-monophosphatase
MSRCVSNSGSRAGKQLPDIDVSATTFPPIRACIFDMDGLLINSEDIITRCMNKLLSKYDRPALNRSIRVRMMGIPGSSQGDVFHNWANLPISRETWARERKEEMLIQFQNCEPLPGTEKLLSDLSHAQNCSGNKIRLALATSCKSRSYGVKMSRPETKQLLDFFQPSLRILGDDARLPHDRQKPAPDIYLLALQSLNAEIDADEKVIMPEECLVFEDSVAGVEAGRRAGMRVVWVPHQDVVAEYGEEKQKLALAGRMQMGAFRDDSQLGNVDDGWAEMIPKLEHFSYEKYGIEIS